MGRKASVRLALAYLAASLPVAAACPKFFVRCEEPRSFIERWANRLGVPTRDFGLGFAMVVGVAGYPELRGPAGLPLPASEKYLRSAAKDIEKLVAFLQQGEFAEIVVLKDRDVTLENLTHFLQAYFPEKLRKVPNSRFLFAYTGHGFERRRSDGGTRSYVLTSAATGLEDLAKSIEMGQVRRMLDEVADAAQHTLVLFNACYGGAFLDQVFGPGPISLSGKGAHAITAGGIGQKVFHIPAVGEGSLFFEKVLEGLRGPADRYGLSPSAGPDGIVTKTELLAYLESTTRAWAEQSPQSGDLLRGKSLGQFFFYVPGRTPDRDLVRELSKKPLGFGGPEDRWLEAKELYRSGQYEEAYPLLYLEEKAGNVEAVAYLAYMFYAGLGGLAKDSAKAVQLYERAAQAGIAWAMNDLGVMHQHGLGGLPKDEVKAVVLFALAADLGEPNGMNNLGAMYGRGLGGLPKDEAKALKLYMQAADLGHAGGMANLGAMYEDGLGGLPKDQGKAVELYKKAADLGDATGMANLGVMYRRGLGGLPKDEGKALELYRQAAALGNALGMANLGFMHQQGLGGLPKDEGKAVELYRKAADLGDATGMRNLALSYLDGTGGLPRDKEKAIHWLREAMRAGDPAAADRLKELGGLR